jgi:hypothetical protein
MGEFLAGTIKSGDRLKEKKVPKQKKSSAGREAAA